MSKKDEQDTSTTDNQVVEQEAVVSPAEGEVQYTGPVKDCTDCEATGLNREDLTKICETCGGSGLIPDES